MSYMQPNGLLLPKGGCVDLLYPPVEVNAPNELYGKMVQRLYAGNLSELTAIAQYSYNHFCFKNQNEDVSKLFKVISMCEMKHLEILAELCIALGIDPTYKAYYNTNATWWSAAPPTINYSKELCMVLLNSIEAERKVVTAYMKTVELIQDEKINLVLTRIAMDHELHIGLLTQAFHMYCS